MTATSPPSSSGPVRLRGNGLRYVEDLEWGVAHAEKLGWVSAARTDSADRVSIFQRRSPEVVVLDRGGSFVGGREVGGITDGHGIFVDTDDALLLVDRDGHRIYRLPVDGPAERLFEGQVELCHPTDVAVDPRTRETFVSDGYGGASVHRFAPDGKLIQSWGGYGNRPGEFNLVHTLAIDGDGRILVADCGNGRIQVFTAGGECVDVWEGLYRPLGIHIDDARGLVFVTEGSTRITARDRAGRVVAAGRAPNNAHGICGDSNGDLYLSIPALKTVVKLVLQLAPDGS